MLHEHMDLAIDGATRRLILLIKWAKIRHIN